MRVHEPRASVIGVLACASVAIACERGNPCPYFNHLVRLFDYTGLDEGLTGMRVGGSRRFIIPPGLAYGSDGKRARVCEYACRVRTAKSPRWLCVRKHTHTHTHSHVGYPRSGDNKGSMIPPDSTLYFQVRLRSVKGAGGGLFPF